MQRRAVFFKLKPGKREGYKKRHDEIWPEISELLSKSGIRNYSVWNHEDLLFGYYEADDIFETESKLMTNAVFLKWRDEMEEYIFKEPQTGQKEWDMSLLFLHE